MTSNLQAVEEMNTPKMKSSIKFLKEEIKYGSVNLSPSDIKENATNNQYCKNMATGKFYPFLKGSSSESELYKVMPLDGDEKIYFDSKDEYIKWREKRNIYLNKNT